ncbi:MAG: hypothetical protein JNM62_05275 [Flavobacteriales bacterium]|nr:hypothetical protein [Flavobacteriales bacterium]
MVRCSGRERSVRPISIRSRSSAGADGGQVLAASGRCIAGSTPTTTHKLPRCASIVPLNTLLATRRMEVHAKKAWMVRGQLE